MHVAVVRDTDGSAFITKAEFDSLKNNFQAQIDNYNSSIDSKIDGAIASYLAGITLATHIDVELATEKLKDLRWLDDLRCYWTYYNASGTSSTKYDTFKNAGFGQGDFAYPISGTINSFYKDTGKLGNSTSAFNIKHTNQDDGNEFWYRIVRYESQTTMADFWGSCEKRVKNLVLIETDVGDINHVVRSLNLGKMAQSNFWTAYGSQNVVGAQTDWYPADATYTNDLLELDIVDGNDTYTIRPRAHYKGHTTSSSYDSYGYNNYELQDYWGWAAVTFYDVTGASNPRNQSFNYTGPTVTTLMFGRPISYYAGTCQYRQTTSFTTGYAKYTWGSTKATTMPLTFKSIHTTAAARTYPTLVEKYSATNPKMSLPSYYSHGSLANYKNYTLAASGLDCGFCDGAPLFTASMNGLAKCELDLTTSNTTAHPKSKIQVNIKKDKFSNSITGNGNTLKYCNEAGVEQGYLQNLTSSTGKFTLYFKVKSGEKYWIRISPDDPTGSYYAWLTDAKISITAD